MQVAVVGAGILGLAHTWLAAEQGHQVMLFERSPSACGASVRNFGMIWPIGQPAGALHRLAMQSRKRWLQLSQIAGIWVNPCGSIHLATREDEWKVLSEFQERSAKLGYCCDLLDAAEVMKRSSAANPEHLLGGLFSETELCVNPRLVLSQVTDWLRKEYGIRTEFSTTITEINSNCLISSDRREWQADKIIICSGADFETLFPEQFSHADLLRCKLQMLKTKPQPNGWRMGPHIASGLTLRHYRNFEICPSLVLLKQRIASETPELDRYGIHVMASQNDSGELILGDSHEYGPDREPFDKAVIEELILRELRKIIQLPAMTISQRWHGIYAKHRAEPWFELEPLPGVHICTGVGGAGMTLSFGIAERFWQQFCGSHSSEMKA